MEKIPSLFQRNRETDKLVRDEVVPGAEWVLAGEGRPTQKFDGQCCLIEGGRLYRRHALKAGGTPPAEFRPVGEVDPVSGKQQGWVPAGDGPDDRWFREAFARGVDHAGVELRDGTYELCGPNVQGNPERFAEHVLVRHGVMMLVDDPRTFDRIKSYLQHSGIEGIVWHHHDGRMVKIKAKDFGLKRLADNTTG